MIEPMIARRGAIEVGFLPDGSSIDPALDERNFVFGKRFAFGWHAFIGILAGDSADQFAFVAFAWLDYLAAVAPFEGRMPGIQPQAPFLHFRPMTRSAARD